MPRLHILRASRERPQGVWVIRESSASTGGAGEARSGAGASTPRIRASVPGRATSTILPEENTADNEAAALLPG